MKQFFDLLRSKGLEGPESLNTIAGWRKRQLLDFVGEAYRTLPRVAETTNSRFGFLANTSLSGGPHPCFDLECRVARADEMARFAVLYADQVLIRDPFEPYFYPHGVNYLRRNLAADIAVLQHLKPLMLSGVVGVAQTSFALCSHHAAEADRENAAIEEKLRGVERNLRKAYLRQLKFEYRKTGYVRITGPEHLITHGQQAIGPLKRSDALGRHGVKGRVRHALFNQLLQPVFDDVVLHDHYLHHYDYRYLTNRDLDAAVIEAVGNEEAKAASRAIVSGLSHSLPILAQVDLDTMLKLRDKEREAFVVYRDSLNELLEKADLSTPCAIREAFQDVVRPELARVDAAVSNARTFTKSTIAKEVVVNAGLVSIGLFVGLVEPTLGAVTALFGGTQMIRKVGTAAYDLAVAEPRAARANRFYFLWKLQEQSVPLYRVRTRD